VLSKKRLDRINARPRGTGPAPFVALGALAAALGVFFLSHAAALVVLIVGLAGALLLRRKDAGRRTATLHYDLDGETGARFAVVRRACETLASSGSVRLAEDRSRRGSGEARTVEMGLLETPGISANVPIWGLDDGVSRVLFFPEAVLLYEEGMYRPLSYASFDATLGPDEASGIVLRLRSPGWPGMDLRVPDEDAAAQFALAFGGGTPEKEAHRLLGVGADAPTPEISSAYRRMARTYHPDRTAGFSPEFRRLAEERMREVNAAYATLKGRST
jgi:hypothetical protein